MKYKVGDKVKVKEGFKNGHCYDGVYFNKKMESYIGEEFKISACKNYFYYNLQDDPHTWTEEMLEKAEKKPLSVYVKSNGRNGKDVIEVLERLGGVNRFELSGDATNL